MEKNIQKQLEIIERANAWVKTSLHGNKAKESYRNLVNCRRKLNKKKYAFDGNPAAAMYGESQVGKSYLISSLLSEEGKPFSITDENNVVHNFIEEINPQGGGSESTSLVSRFSVKYKPNNPKFPIKAVLLSPADIVLVLCDSFYNDIKAIHDLTLDIATINSEIDAIQTRHKDRKPIQAFFVEDEVLDIQDYFACNLSKASNVLSSNLFEVISGIIERVQPFEWPEVFSLLWNRNEQFTKLFRSLITEFEKIHFSGTVFLPLNAVLYRYGTLLDVKRLHEINGTRDEVLPDYVPDTVVLLPDNSEKKCPKSYLCALTAELVFSQSESLIAKKPFLKETDLLDFPGARSRKTTPENNITQEVIPDFLIRGKVAFLFNKYSESEKINILLFCAKHEMAAQRAMPEMLNNWVGKTVGKTPEKREQFVSTSKIPPLFVIGTFFNVNLAFNPLLDKPGEQSSLDYRWNQRFDRTLASEMFNTEIYNWFNNWTTSQSDFKNIYLLRDFEKSETPSNLFKGYNENKREQEEVNPNQYPDFRQKLRKSFIEYNFVKRHFANPEESWDEAASINKDGTELIIKNLTIVANNINPARMVKMQSEINDINQTILAELLKHFHSNDKDEKLQKAKNIAGDIQFKLATAFSADKIKDFGQLMKELMIDESTVLSIFRKEVESLGHRDLLNLDTYSVFRIEMPVEKDDTAEKYFERLCVRYEKTTEERREEFRKELEAKQIDLDELIKGNSDLIKNNARQLADALIEYWLEYILLSEKQVVQQILAQDSALENIKDMYEKLFKKLCFSDRIAEKIRRYVEGYSKTDLPYEIVADISTELLNKCINTVGVEYLDDSEITSLRQANDNNNLGLVFDTFLDPTESSVEDLFERIENWTSIIQTRPEELRSLPNYRNYLTWSHRLKIGFVSVCDIPNYDVTANTHLREIIEECDTI
ncbi:MAG: putative virulence factor [Bacteroidetes bacterium]|nr:putative virulence factor [Bacteroidota bacterium]MBU1718043.1 putative virulence factor [Bacteroidota bacterium]